MLEKLKKNGGKREARFAWELPEMGEKTPARDPRGHWGRVEAHLRAVSPRNKRALRKAKKMLTRVAAERDAGKEGSLDNQILAEKHREAIDLQQKARRVKEKKEAYHALGALMASQGEENELHLMTDEQVEEELDMLEILKKLGLAE